MGNPFPQRRRINHKEKEKTRKKLKYGIIKEPNNKKQEQTISNSKSWKKFFH
jgi:hypothetical protein